jgi:phytoene dehydrogenase-like protein
MACDYKGQTAYLYRDIEKLRGHFLELSPVDKREINILCSDIRKFAGLSMPVTDIKGVRVHKKPSMHPSMFFSMIPAITRMSFYSGQTVGEYTGRFKSPLLRLMLGNIIGKDFCATGMIGTLATLASGDGGYPVGGSLGMASRMAEYFEKLGGRVIYKNMANRVLVKDGVARGIIVNGSKVEADAVIVTQDTRAAIDTMFENPINEPWAEKMRKNTRPMLDTFICLGIGEDLSDIPERVEFIPGRPFTCGGQPQEIIGICNYAGYKGYAPDGCSAITSIIVGDSYDFWKSCKENGTYQAEKEKMTASLIEILEEKYPKISGRVAVWDVATPLTYERYIHSYKGSWMSLMGKGSAPDRYPSKPEGIRNLYFASQRLMSPGGLPAAAVSGRRAVQYLCLDTDTVFQGCMD